jgi:hypothetical protein
VTTAALPPTECAYEHVQDGARVLTPVASEVNDDGTWTPACAYHAEQVGGEVRDLILEPDEA